MEAGVNVLVALVPYVLAAVVVWIVFVVRGVSKGWLANAGTPTEAGVAWAAVNAVEQLFFDQEGEFKYDAAAEFFARYFPDLDDAKVRMWLEAAVKQMNDAQAE